MTFHTPETGRIKHVLALVRDTPWAIEQQTFDAIREMLALRADGIRFTPEEIEARTGGPKPAASDLVMHGSVAVLPIQGVISPRADLFTQISGGTSTDRLRAQLRQAVDDENVSGIVLDVNSPGGSVEMLTELAGEIRAARDVKPVTAVANAKAASAAYWLAAQAGEVYVTPSGSVGSIGVVAAHEDISGQEQQDGVKTTLVTAGKYKAAANPFGPLDDEGRAVIQERVDDSYAMFVDDVAAGRRTSPDTVKTGFGEGKMLPARKAVDAGMADGVMTLEQVLENMPQTAPPAAGNMVASRAEIAGFIGDYVPLAALPAPQITEQADALHRDAAALLDRVSSLAEVKRGHLTVSKRERLSACTGALANVVAELEALLETTDPDKHRREARAEYARLLEAEITTHGGQA